jgi:hypothetical protein
MLKSVSSTFHGRDVFAPVAAHLACGTSPQETGAELDDYVELSFGEPEFTGRVATCEIIHVDHFGNVITNISQENMHKLRTNGKLSITIRRKRFQTRSVRSYSQIREKEFGLIVGSHGFLEIAARKSNASKRLRAKAGDVIAIRPR